MSAKGYFADSGIEFINRTVLPFTAFFCYAACTALFSRICYGYV